MTGRTWLGRAVNMTNDSDVMTPRERNKPASTYVRNTLPFELLFISCLFLCAVKSKLPTQDSKMNVLSMITTKTTVFALQAWDTTTANSSQPLVAADGFDRLMLLRVTFLEPAQVSAIDLSPLPVHVYGTAYRH